MDISIATRALEGLIFCELFTDTIEFAGTIFWCECFFIDGSVAGKSEIRDFVLWLGRTLADLHEYR